jgi:hypothetical protein
MGVLVDLDTAFDRGVSFPCFSYQYMYAPRVRIEREFDWSELSVRKIEVSVTINDEQLDNDVLQTDFHVLNRTWATLSRRVTPVPLFSAMHCVTRRFKQYRKEQFFLPAHTNVKIA